MARIRKCQRCKADEAIWAWQPDLDAIYAIGWHQRGFTVVAICDACRDEIRPN